MLLLIPAKVASWCERTSVCSMQFSVGLLCILLLHGLCRSAVNDLDCSHGIVGELDKAVRENHGQARQIWLQPFICLDVAWLRQAVYLTSWWVIRCCPFPPPPLLLGKGIVRGLAVAHASLFLLFPWHRLFLRWKLVQRERSGDLQADPRTLHLWSRARDSSPNDIPEITQNLIVQLQDPESCPQSACKLCLGHRQNLGDKVP